MTELLTAAQMRAIEQAAIASGEVTGLELMERAGRGVVEAIFEEWPELAEGAERGAGPSRTPGYLQQEEGSRRAVVLCGPGNNGGDGFVVARLLKERGWTVEVFLYGDPEKLPADARVNYERWRGMGEVLELQGFALDQCSPMGWPDGGCTLVVDATFGTGLTRPVDGALAQVLQPLAVARPGERPPVVSIDIPSGICADSGRVLGMALSAELTVTFHLHKRGHHLGNGPPHTGTLNTAPIGLQEQYPHPLTGIVLNDISEPGGHLAFCDKERTAGGQVAVHKYGHGHALILSGGAGRTGAARLAARGALRIGAGLVTVGVPEAAQAEVAAQVTAVMMRRVEDGEGLAEVLADKRINALCLGPGLGVERAAELVAVALGSGGVEPRPAVLDADALTAIAGDMALFGALHDRCILTPHGGEFARLFPDLAEKLAAPAVKGPAYSKVDAAREAASRARCVVLFKGPDTVIASPEGRCSINSANYERAAPWLATAGSGDVLAGFIAGLLARGFAPMQAAETAAWLHVECARSFGPGLIAEDLPEALPNVFRGLGL